MHKIKILITIFLIQSPFLVAGPFNSFLQSSATTRRSGPASDTSIVQPESGGILGVPGIASPSETASPRDDTDPSDFEEDEDQSRRERALSFIDSLRQRGTLGGRSSRESSTPVPSKSETSMKAGEEGVTLTFKNASIEEVVNVIMKELGYSYIIDPEVTGTVNLFTQKEFPRTKLFEVLGQLLKMNGQAIIRQEDLYVILPIGQSPSIPGSILKRPNSMLSEVQAKGESSSGAVQSSKKTQSDVDQGEIAVPELGKEGVKQATTIPVAKVSQQREQLKSEEGVITYIVPLHHIPSAEMVTMVKAFVSDGAQVVDFQSANILILTDYRANIEQALEIIRLLDTEYFDVNVVDLVPVRYHQAVDVAEDLAQIYAPGEKAGGVRIVAIERLNSILVITHAPEVFAEVENWIQKLDTPSGGSNIRTFVYQVENNTANNIAEILSQLYSDGAGLPSGAGSKDSKEGPESSQQRGRQRQEAAFLPEGQNRTGSAGLPLGPSLGGRSAQSAVRAAVITGDIKIIVNEFNNSLVIQGTEADYKFLRETIVQLDILPRQVLIEAKIYAVELRNDLSYGVSWFLQDRLSEQGHATTGSITSVGDEGGGGVSGATRFFVGAYRQFDIVIDALRTKTNVEILESPTLLVVDGTEAQINVGAEVPVTTASFGDPLRSGSNTSFVNSISFRPTGTTLLLLPRISSSGMVAMDLAIEVSNASGPALTPTINRNFVRTSLIAKDGQQIGIAGVISDNFDYSNNRVPILGDIPVIGALFGQTSRSKRRFELIFLITPHVVSSVPTAAELTLEFKRALRNAYGFIKEKEVEDQELRDGRRKLELKTKINP